MLILSSVASLLLLGSQAVAGPIAAPITARNPLSGSDQILALHSTILLKARADSYNEIISVFDKDEDYASISGGNASRTHGEFNLLAEIAATFVRTMFNEFAIDPHTLPSFVDIKVLTNNNVKDSIGGLGTAEFAIGGGIQSLATFGVTNQHLQFRLSQASNMLGQAQITLVDIVKGRVQINPSLLPSISYNRALGIIAASGIIAVNGTTGGNSPIAGSFSVSGPLTSGTSNNLTITSNPDGIVPGVVAFLTGDGSLFANLTAVPNTSDQFSFVVPEINGQQTIAAVVKSHGSDGVDIGILPLLVNA